MNRETSQSLKRDAVLHMENKTSKPLVNQSSHHQDKLNILCQLYLVFNTMNYQEVESTKTQKYLVGTPLRKRIKNIINSSKAPPVRQLKKLGEKTKL